uniref:tuberoinfundibular peptide of 39 residues n=1 Tax=Pristiophorus japonicus TaxID=55135 RepID=UPI00398F2F6B
MEPAPTARVLLVGLILSYMLGPCPGALPPSLGHMESSPLRFWKTENSPGLTGAKQAENILPVAAGWDPSVSLPDWDSEKISSFLALKGLPAKDSGSWWLPSLRRQAWFSKLPVEPRNDGDQSHNALGDGAGLTRITLGKSWSSDWLEPNTNEEVKRSIVVADDVAFREKSKFLTVKQRQKWLNSVMRQLVINKK